MSLAASSSGDIERLEALDGDRERIEILARFLSGVWLLEAGLLGWDPMSDMANTGCRMRKELRAVGYTSRGGVLTVLGLRRESNSLGG